MTTPAINVRQVTKQYGDITALDNVSLSIEKGHTFGLLGTNGAGKSTLFRLLIGHITPDSGQLEVMGHDVGTMGVSIRSAVGYLPERAGFPDNLTATEVLRFHARMHGLSNRDQRIIDVLQRVGIGDAANRRVGGFSKGMRRRLGLATALLPRPDILLLDEPTAGLDPLGIAAFHRIISDLRSEGDLTLLLSSHAFSEVELLCDRVGILNDGEMLATGPPTGLRSQDNSVIIRIRVTEAIKPESIDDLATNHSGEMRGTRGNIAIIECPSKNVPTLLETLIDEPTVTGYEIQDASLKQAFLEEVLATSESESTETMTTTN
ncbi:MAG: ABC transporter ATP-binding protein [Halobacteriaceae archaeon]